MRTRPSEVALWKASGLRVFYIADKRDLSTWGNLERLVRRWEDIEGPGLQRAWTFADEDLLERSQRRADRLIQATSVSQSRR